MLGLEHASPAHRTCTAVLIIHRALPPLATGVG
eukprot:COSAG01_NODE_74137_length_226_cov_20.976378_1_plen_32_part_01